MWYSIHASQSVVLHGCRWKIGKRDTIRVWNLSWINNDDEFQTNTPCPEGLQEMGVRELLAGDSRSWDVQVLEGLFNPADVRSNLRIPLPPRGWRI